MDHLTDELGGMETLPPPQFTLPVFWDMNSLGQKRRHTHTRTALQSQTHLPGRRLTPATAHTPSRSDTSADSIKSSGAADERKNKPPDF